MTTLQHPYVLQTKVRTTQPINVLIQRDRRVTKITIPPGTYGVVIDVYSTYGMNGASHIYAIGIEWDIGYHIEAYVLSDDKDNFNAIEVLSDAA